MARLVRGGVYTIYLVRGASSEPYLLVTSDGVLHGLSTTGRILEPIFEKRLSDFSIERPINVADTSHAEPVIRINNP